MLAKEFAEKGNKKRCLYWANLAEKAWEKYTKIFPKWFNSYFFYAMALGYQQKNVAMESAIKKAAKNAGKTMQWRAIKELRTEIQEVLDLL